MQSTLITLLITMFATLMLYFFIYKQGFRFNVYANIIILVLVSLFLGYHISNMSAQGAWYQYCLIGIFVYGIYNVLMRVKQQIEWRG
ncbi:MAG: hypothetical protein WBP43_15200 [Chitinophagales bacterium]